MTEDVREPRRNRRRSPSQELAGGAVEELKRLARIPQENPDPVFHISAEHVLLYRNPAGQELCRAWGCRLGQKVPTVIQRIVSAALADGAVARHEVAFGSHVYGLTVAPAVADGYVNLYARDITDYKRAQEALRQAEEKFRTIFDNTSDGIFLLDLEARRFTMCNQSCLQMLGYTQEEFLNLGIADLHVPADLPFIHAQIEEFLKGGRGTRRDIRFKRKDGSILFVDLSPDLVQLDGKRQVVVALKDITERKRMEEELCRHAEHLEELVAARTGELQESERRYRSLAENAPDIIQRFDRDLRRLYVNPAFELATGLPSDAGIGKTDRELGLPTDLIPFWEQAAQTVFRTGKNRIIEFEMPTPRGPRHYEAHLVPEFARDGSTEHLLVITRDITERKQAEEALLESEERYRILLEHGFDGIFVHEDFRIVQLNDRLAEMAGCARSELMGGKLIGMFTPDSQEHIRQYTRSGVDGYIELQLRRPDGRIVEVESYGVPCKFQGRNARIVGLRDITERKQAEEALRESEAGLAAAQRLAHIGSWQWNIAVDTAHWSEETFRIFGLAHGPLQQHREGFISRVIPEDRQRVDQALSDALSGTRDYDLDYRIRLPDGRERVIHAQAQVLRNNDGRPITMHGTVQDITERKRAEEALCESEERFRAAFEEGAVAMALTAMDGTLLKVNSSFCRMLGFREAELVGRSYTEITHPDDRAANLVGTRRLASGEISAFRMEERYVRKDGGIVWGDMNTASVHNAQGRPLYCVTHVQDITDRRQAEEALRRLNERLELQVAQRTEELRHTVDRLQQLTLELSQAEDRERKRIADILHDDVQQTLAAAKFHLNLLGREIRSAEESQEIVEQVKQMLKDAIEKSRRLSHELSPALYQVDLTAILDWLAQHMQQKHGLTVRVEARGPVNSPSEPLKAFLYKVVQELLFNVVKHAGVREARIRVRRLGPYLYLSVADRGRGFDPQRLETTPGFGLLGIRERVQLLGGRMKIKSTPGTGSTLLIAVPYEAPSRTAGPAWRGGGQVPSEVPA